ncbi:ATP-binding cassette domain-containing protein [Kribbella solani]|uniref:ABC transporter ATP-binding protein n=1 Tax=Kribbella solani TaxID=236067 RepID=UPI0029B56F99|nr:oligopeptide/dipeptide ABC transporter ATP-binding protein [Kribbella solani]MDX3001851.1 ATP-binding cassette domain-containing protein [Kribbella solani]
MNEFRFAEVDVQYGSGRQAMKAVDQVSLVVPAGKVVGLVGESGSGKSTLARAAVGLAPISAGQVLLDGGDVRRARRRGLPPPIQLIFQDPSSALDPRMSVGASIAEAIPRPVRRNRATRQAEVARLLELVGLDPDRMAMLPGLLSGGQRQRVAFARALAARPSVLIADEVTSALDVSVQGGVLNLMRDLQSRLGLSMLFISHNLAVVRYISDYIAVMYLGRIVEAGPVVEVLKDPRHPYTRELFDAAPHRNVQSTLLDDEMPAELATVEPPDPHQPPPGCRFHTRCPVGPLLRTDRDLCVQADPQAAAAERAHQAACHFADSPVGSPAESAIK